MPDDNNQPIFLHGLWRTGSTYFWHKFKQSDAQLRCFFEPFHHSLHKSHQDLCLDYDRASSRFDLKFVHDNYYNEYEAGANGVAGYHWHFATDDYQINAVDECLPIGRYIKSLCQLARVNQQRPILQFNRAILRGDWLNKTFDATSLYIIRSPQDSLKSYNRLSNGRNLNYYMSAYLGIVGRNSNNILFHAMAKHLNIKYQHNLTYSGHLKHYAKAFNRLTTQQRLDLFLFFWALGLCEATKYAKEVLDTSLVTQQSQQQCAWHFQHILKNTTGVNLDLTDLNVQVNSQDPLEPSPRAKKIIIQAINQLSPKLEMLERWSLSKQTLVQLYEISGITTRQVIDKKQLAIAKAPFVRRPLADMPFDMVSTGSNISSSTDRSASVVHQ